MKTPTFREQYNKIVSAYIKDELDPFQVCACFVGNLLNGDKDWQHIRDFWDNGESMLRNPNKWGFPMSYSQKCIAKQSGGLYNAQEILDLENLFLKTLNYSPIVATFTEENLFKAMEVTLQKLREIHESKGEIVEDYTFTKRQLVEI
jgi:hypothetical protein